MMKTKTTARPQGLFWLHLIMIALMAGIAALYSIDLRAGEARPTRARAASERIAPAPAAEAAAPAAASTASAAAQPETPAVKVPLAAKAPVKKAIAATKAVQSAVKKAAWAPSAAENQTFVIVEEMPEVIGGPEAVANAIRYPDAARKKGLHGRVVVEFVVDERGNVTEPRVVQGIGPELDQAAVSAVRSLYFDPGRQRGEEVRVKMALPIMFKLK